MCLRSHSKQEAELGFKYRHSFQSLLFQIPCYLWVAVVQSLSHVWCSVTSHSLRPHRLQHARLPCPPLSPTVCSNSCPLSQWCHPTISFSVVPFSCLQSFPAWGSFLLRITWPKYWRFSFSISPFNEYLGLISFRIDWLISLLTKGCSRVFSSTKVQKHQFFGVQLSLWSNCHICTWLLEKPLLWLYRSLLAKWCLCFLIHCLGLS